MSAQRYPERLRYYIVNKDNGYTIIRDPSDQHESIEYSTDVTQIRKSYAALILRKDPEPHDVEYVESL